MHFVTNFAWNILSIDFFFQLWKDLDTYGFVIWETQYYMSIV